ncbi:MAG TPA: response regulator [Verrucomicrobiae bacterium]|nr:response regulator [Verrucomicrobiae bacterium]
MQPNESPLTCEQGTLLLSELGRKRRSIEEALQKLGALAARESKSPGSLTNMEEANALVTTIEAAVGHFGATLNELLHVDGPQYHLPMYRRTRFLAAVNKWDEDDQTKAMIAALQKQDLRLTIEQRKEMANGAHEVYIATRNHCSILSGALELAIHKCDRAILETSYGYFCSAVMNIKRLPVALGFMLAKMSHVENPWQHLGMVEDEYRAFNNAKRLLLVEKGSPGQFVFKTILTEQGKHDVVTVSSATEALKRLKNSTGFDAVITSIHLSGMNGAELTKHIKLLYRGLPVILTGWSLITAEHGRVKDYATAGAMDHVPADLVLLQPILPKELLDSVIKLTSNHGPVAASQGDK